MELLPWWKTCKGRPGPCGRGPGLPPADGGLRLYPGAGSRKGVESRSAVANSLRLLNLPPQGLDALRSGAITTGHAKAILGLESPEKQAEALAMVLKQQLTVRQTEALCKKLAKAPRRRRETFAAAACGRGGCRAARGAGHTGKVQYKGGKGSLQVYFIQTSSFAALRTCLARKNKREKKCWISNLCGKTRNW